MSYKIVDVKSGKKGRPAKVVEFEDGTKVALKVWIKTTDEGKAYAKAIRQAKKVAAQAAPVTPVSPEAAPATVPADPVA